MKKLFGLVILASLMFSGAASAATYYRVDFNGTIGDGTYDGYFTYDAVLAINPDSDRFHSYATESPESIDGFEVDLEFNYAFSGGAGSFDETNAGIGTLAFDDNVLISWFIGGNPSGIKAIINTGPVDFGAISEGPNGRINIPGPGLLQFDAPVWEQTEISAVPLPAAVWAFGAGLVALFGLQRRRKAKAGTVTA